MAGKVESTKAKISVAGIERKEWFFFLDKVVKGWAGGQYLTKDKDELIFNRGGIKKTVFFLVSPNEQDPSPPYQFGCPNFF